jgi:hypothetical protein
MHKFWALHRTHNEITADAHIRGIPRAMSDQDQRHSVANADLRRGARSPNPAAVLPMPLIQPMRLSAGAAA